MDDYSFSQTPGLVPNDVFTFVSNPYAFHKCRGKYVPPDLLMHPDFHKVQGRDRLEEFFCVYAKVEGSDRPGVVRIVEVPSEMMGLVQACYKELGIDNMQTVRWKYMEVLGSNENLRTYIVPWKVNQGALPEVTNYEPIKKYISKKVPLTLADVVFVPRFADVPVPEMKNPCKEIPLDNRTITGDTDLFDFGDSNESDSYNWVHS